MRSLLYSETSTLDAAPKLIDFCANKRLNKEFFAESKQRSRTRKIVTSFFDHDVLYFEPASTLKSERPVMQFLIGRSEELPPKEPCLYVLTDAPIHGADGKVLSWEERETYRGMVTVGRGATFILYVSVDLSTDIVSVLGHAYSEYPRNAELEIQLTELFADHRGRLKPRKLEDKRTGRSQLTRPTNDKILLDFLEGRIMLEGMRHTATVE